MINDVHVFGMLFTVIDRHSFSISNLTIYKPNPYHSLVVVFFFQNLVHILFWSSNAIPGQVSSTMIFLSSIKIVIFPFSGVNLYAFCTIFEMIIEIISLLPDTIYFWGISCSKIIFLYSNCLLICSTVFLMRGIISVSSLFILLNSHFVIETRLSKRLFISVRVFFILVHVTSIFLVFVQRSTSQRIVARGVLSSLHKKQNL